MQTYTPATRAALDRGDIVSRPLIWIRAANRTTGAEETIGLWHGEDAQDFVVDGETRTYYGAGALLELDPIVYQTGLTVRMQRFRLSSVSDEVKMAMRGYEPRHAPVDVHRALMTPGTHQLVDAPHRIFRGYIDTAPIRTAAIGGTGSIEVQMASTARALTIPLNRKRSDESLRARSPSDAFRKYATVAATVTTKWGVS